MAETVDRSEDMDYGDDSVKDDSEIFVFIKTPQDTRKVPVCRNGTVKQVWYICLLSYCLSVTGKMRMKAMTFYCTILTSDQLTRSFNPVVYAMRVYYKWVFNKWSYRAHQGSKEEDVDVDVDEDTLWLTL